MLQAPGSLTTWAPWRSSGSQRQNDAPSGSATTAARPAGGASNGATATVPPARVTASAVASALSTRM